MSLFGEETAPPPRRPLAERMRPCALEEIEGQEEALGPGTALRAAIESGRVGSLILWGPPGSGKTTLARLLAERSGLPFRPFSAVLSGIKEVREAIAAAGRRGGGLLLFVDEIHRFNKAQQDAFLPHVERGDLVLVGATTENPSFSVIAPLLSRCRVVRLEPLDDAALRRVLARALEDRERGLGARNLRLDEAALERLLSFAGGDARRALGGLEAAADLVADGAVIDAATMARALQQRTLAHDKAGDHHYDLLSALHKSLRSSDVQAALYWLARLIEAGGDPMQAARRMVAMAAEDVGLADPMALQIAVNAMQALSWLGLPEGRLPLAQAAIYLASAPKSDAVIRAIDAAAREVREGRQHPVPEHLRNAPTALARALGHGRGYVSAHEVEGGVPPISCLPEALGDVVFYTPGERGFERRIAERLAAIERRRRGSFGQEEE